MRKSVMVLLGLITFVLFLILIVGVGLLFKYVPAPSIDEIVQTGLRENPIYEEDPIPYCGDELIFFNLAPLSLRDVHSIAPLGNLNPPAHTFPTDHLYFYLPREGFDANVTRRVPVVSPSKGWITQIKISRYNDHEDYSLYIQPCKQITLEYGHLSGLSERLTAYIQNVTSCNSYETGGTTYEHCVVDVLLPTSAAEPLGTAGGIPFQFALDIGVYDTRVHDINLVNPFRLDFTAYGTPTCPLNYFFKDVRDQLIEKIGTQTATGFTNRTVEPVCGKIFQDVPRTLQGIWFLKGSINYLQEDKHLAFVHDNFNPSIPRISMGTSLPNLPADIYTFEVRDPTGTVNVDFNETRVGETYCYEFFDARNRITSILVSLTDDQSITIEAFPARLCDSELDFSDAALFFTR